MIYDVDSDFGSHSPPNLSQLLEIQSHEISRDFTQRWPDSLRFLCTADHGQKDYPQNAEGGSCACEAKPCLLDGASSLRVTRKNPPEFPGCTHYVAVSYCWKAQGEELPKYSIDAETIQRRNIAPSMIIDRAIAFALAHSIKLIWIDQECIFQGDREDKEMGIQSMDLVYQRASHPVALLSLPMRSQLHLSALLKAKDAEEFLPEELLCVVEALEDVMRDRWFTRTWCFQEVVAAGESMKLLIPCDENFEGGEERRRIKGEFEISIQILRESATWTDSWVDSMWQEAPHMHEVYGRGVKERAHSVYERIRKVCPVASIQLGERDPDFRYGCNASQGLQLMHEKENRRISDRLAILANLCNFRRRLNTHLLEEAQALKGVEWSFGVCATVLAFINGDISMLIGSRLEVESKPNKTDSPRPHPWLPVNGIPLIRMHFEEEFHGEVFRVSGMRLCREGLRMEAFVWKFDRRVDLRAVREEFYNRWQKEAGIFEDNAPDPNELLREVFFSILHILCSRGLESVANSIWHCIRPTHTNEGVRDPEQAMLDSDEVGWEPHFIDVPEKIDDLLSGVPQSQSPSVKDQYEYLKHFLWSDQISFDHGFSWLAQSVIDTGSLPIWTLVTPDPDHRPSAYAVFDTHMTDPVLTPYSEALEGHPRSILAAEAVSWIVEPSQENVPDGILLNASKMVRGAWYAGGAVSDLYVLGW